MYVNFHIFHYIFSLYYIFKKTFWSHFCVNFAKIYIIPITRIFCKLVYLGTQNFYVVHTIILCVHDLLSHANNMLSCAHNIYYILCTQHVLSRLYNIISHVHNIGCMLYYLVHMTKFIYKLLTIPGTKTKNGSHKIDRQSYWFQLQQLPNGFRSCISFDNILCAQHNFFQKKMFLSEVFEILWQHQLLVRFFNIPTCTSCKGRGFKNNLIILIFFKQILQIHVSWSNFQH